MTPHNRPAHIIQDDSKALWNDLIGCFVWGRFYEVAQILNLLPYKREHTGVFDVSGPLKTRKEIFRLLTPYRDRRPGVQLAVKIKFFRNVVPGMAQEGSDLTTGNTAPLTIEHWAGRLWKTSGETVHPQDETTPDHDLCREDLVLG